MGENYKKRRNTRSIKKACHGWQAEDRMCIAHSVLNRFYTEVKSINTFHPCRQLELPEQEPEVQEYL